MERGNSEGPGMGFELGLFESRRRMGGTRVKDVSTRQTEMSSRSRRGEKMNC